MIDQPPLALGWAALCLVASVTAFAFGVAEFGPLRFWCDVLGEVFDELGSVIPVVQNVKEMLNEKRIQWIHSWIVPGIL